MTRRYVVGYDRESDVMKFFAEVPADFVTLYVTFGRRDPCGLDAYKINFATANELALHLGKVAPEGLEYYIEPG
jgi:hypothetical protein